MRRLNPVDCVALWCVGAASRPKSKLQMSKRASIECVIVYDGNPPKAPREDVNFASEEEGEED